MKISRPISDVGIFQEERSIASGASLPPLVIETQIIVAIITPIIDSPMIKPDDSKVPECRDCFRDFSCSSLLRYFLFRYLQESQERIAPMNNGVQIVAGR